VLSIYLLYLNNNFHSPEAYPIDQTYHSQCALQFQDCSLHLSKDIHLVMSMLPKGLPALEKLSLKISSQESDITQFRNVVIWLEGRDMNMGKHFFQLNARQTGSQVLHARGMIPVCSVDDSMVWRLVAQFSYGGSNVRINLDLQAKPLA